MRDLRGRLEVIYVTRPNKSNVSFGATYDGRAVSVINYQINSSGLCLVRFPFINSNLSSGNFISFLIPDNFPSRGFAPEDFVFVGKWNKKWVKEGDYPTLDELNIYYDPGRIGAFIYFERKFRNKLKGKKFKIHKDSVLKIPDHISIREVISDWLPYPNKSARVVMAESKEEYFSIIRQIRRQNMTPIELDPLKRYL